MSEIDSLSDIGSNDSKATSVSNDLNNINGEVDEDSWCTKNIGIIFLCIIFLAAIGVALYYILKKDKLGNKSFKCIEGNCREINKYPDGRKGRYSNLAACKNECNNSNPVYNDSYECKGGGERLGEKQCVKVTKKVDDKTVFQTFETCESKCLPDGWSFEDIQKLRSSVYNFLHENKIYNAFDSVDECKSATNDKRCDNLGTLQQINELVFRKLVFNIQQYIKDPKNTESKLQELLTMVEGSGSDSGSKPNEKLQQLMIDSIREIVPLYTDKWKKDITCERCTTNDNDTPDSDCKYDNADCNSSPLEKIRRW